MSTRPTFIHPRLMRRVSNQSGQILPITLAGVALAVAIMVMLANIGNRITEKSVAVDAADAAAYSGATFVAQHLNFMAYTNRAMVANHIGVGHFVAYMSWIRYVDDTVDKVEDLLKSIPVANVIAGVLEQAADILRQVADIEGRIFVPAVNGLNLFYHVSQLEAHATLGVPTNLPFTGQSGGLPVTPVDRLMQATAESFDPDIKVNSFGDIAKLDSSMSVPLIALLALQNPRIVTFVRPDNAESGGGGGIFRPDLVRWVEATYGKTVDLDGPVLGDPAAGEGLNPNLPDFALDFTQFRGEMSAGWLNNRRIIEDPLSLIDYIPIPDAFEDTVKDFFDFPSVKGFTTEHTLTNNLADWETTDSLGSSSDDDEGGAQGAAFSSGEASAREFDSNYRGIPGWYDLTIPIPGHQILPIIAYTSKDQSNSDTNQGFGLQAGDQPLSGIAIAHVEHRRPTEGFDPLISLPFPIDVPTPIEKGAEFFDIEIPDLDLEANDEYANMFNPFWRAKIVGTHYSDLKQADPLTNIIEGIF